ncbi:MAG: hypothetical protein AAGK22_08815 [Acidobacteriota bacterium]
MSASSRSDRLESWKEIASYLGRSVRTARRWEAEEGLPVHRHQHRAAGSVFAFVSEIDDWRASRSSPSRRAERPQSKTRIVATAKPAEGLVVLPFRYIGPRPEDEEYLADGFTDEVITALSKQRRFRVISRTSAMTLRDSARDAPTLGRDLSVGWIVDGSLRIQGERLRVSTQLVEAATDRSAWSESFTGSLEEIFDIQEEIAARVSHSLQIELPDSPSGPRRDLDAWRCLQQARRESLRWRQEAIDRAVRLLTNGLREHPEDNELRAALARAHLQYREAGLDLGPEPLARASAIARELEGQEDPRGTAAQLRGWICYSKGDIQGAVRELRETLTVDWNNPDGLALLANCLIISGRAGQARPLIEQALSIDPLTPLNRCMPGWADASEGRFEEALGPYREMFEMDPANPFGRLFLLWILTLTGRDEEALEIAEGFAPMAGSLPAQVADLFVSTLGGPDVTESLHGALEREPLTATSDLFPRLLAQAYGLRGDAERALHWLELAMDNGYINHPRLASRDPTLEHLRDRPEFRALLQEIKRRWDAFEA